MLAGVRTWTAAAAVVLVAGVSLTACGDKDEAKGDASTDTTKTAATLTQDNAFATLSKAQAKAGSSHVKLTAKVGGQDITASGDFKSGKDPADSALKMELSTGQAGLGQVEMRLVDEVFYLNFGPLTQNKFAKIDLSDPNNPIGKQFGDIVDGVNPVQQLEQFQDAITTFEKDGDTKKIDGVQTQPYKIVVDTSKVKAFDDLGDSASKLPDELTFTMFVGPDNLPRRVVSELPGLGAGTATITTDYSQWGEDVSIEKPEPSEITDQDPFSGFGALTGSA